MIRASLSESSNFAPSTLILAAARCWRRARDSGRPVQAALFKTLDGYRCGMLAPAFASLLALHESRLGRRIKVGGPDPRSVSADEQLLLVLLDRPDGAEAGIKGVSARSGLSGVMGIAVRSTRILLQAALGSGGAQARQRLARPSLSQNA